MPKNHKKHYTAADHNLFNSIASVCNTKQDILLVAPLVAKKMQRTTCAICKQLEIILNIPWYS